MSLIPTFLVRSFLDCFFPILCLGCDREGGWLCHDCFGRLPRRSEQHCPACQKRITPFGQPCSDCLGTTPLNGVFVASRYRAPLVARTIHTFKYRFVPDLAIPLGDLLSEQLRLCDAPLPDIIVPVPLHPRRLRFRGFNQSELLARKIALRLAPLSGLDVRPDILVRRRYTSSQIQTHSRQEREENLKNAFAVAPESATALTGTHVWLVDDVVTTGTTLTECARALKQAGARSVFGIVLAQ